MVAERSVDVGLGAKQIPFPARDRRAGIKRRGRLVGDEIHRAGGGIAAVQRTLRTLEHLDALQIHHLERKFRIVHQVNFVEIYAHRLRTVGREVIEADPAQREDWRGIADCVLGGQGGRDNREIHGLHRSRFGERGASECINRHRHVLQTLSSLLSGYDDFLKDLLCDDYSPWQQDRDKDEAREYAVRESHGWLPSKDTRTTG